MFLIVARAPPASQTNRLICPTKNIQRIDERMVAAKSRVPETSIFIFTKKSAYVIIGASGGVIRAQ
jgi:hypothetical protein